MPNRSDSTTEQFIKVPPIKVQPVLLDAQLFTPFGDVITTSSAKEVRTINEGNTTRYHDLAKLDLNEGQGYPTVNIFRSTPLLGTVAETLKLRTFERHPLSSQAFYPLGTNPYLVVVAPAGEFDPTKLRVFLASANQGVNYHRGTWHHYSLALDHASDFLVIDRDGPEDNCDEVHLSEEAGVEINLDGISHLIKEIR